MPEELDLILTLARLILTLAASILTLTFSILTLAVTTLTFLLLWKLICTLHSENHTQKQKRHPSWDAFSYHKIKVLRCL